MHAQRMTALFAALLAVVSVCRAQQSSPKPKDFSFTPDDLELLDKSNQLDKQFQEKGLVFNDPGTTKYLSKVGHAVLPEGLEYQNVQWQFFILRDPIPNAFALPNGSIYVHTGLLAILENEAQLVGVLAHEETHVMNRHGYLENRRYRKKAETGMVLVGAASVARVTGGIGGAAALTVEMTVPSVLASSTNGYSRDFEEEADSRAVHALVDAGYPAAEMKTLFELMQKDHDVDLSKPGFYQDHPKLQDRGNYVGKLAASLQPGTAGSAVQADRYFIETESAVRHDADLEIRAGRARTAVWAMDRIVKRDNQSADNFYVLGEAYLGLGARTPEPKPEELTEKGKEEARKMTAKMTPQEYEAALLKAPGGAQALQSNHLLAESNYRRAIEISPDLPGPHRGLGFLYEQDRKPKRSIEEFRKYLDLAPSAMDSQQVRRRLDAMENGSATSSQ
jgi:beta-barrel assembly-enhancing protease